MNKLRYLSLLLAVVLIEGVSSAPLQAQILWPGMQVGQPWRRATATVHNQTGGTVKVFANNRYMFDLRNDERRDLIYPIGQLNLSARLPNGAWRHLNGFNNQNFIWRLQPVMIQMQIENNTGEMLKLVYNGKQLGPNIPPGVSAFQVPTGKHQLKATLQQTKTLYELNRSHWQDFTWKLGPFRPLPGIQPPAAPADGNKAGNEPPAPSPRLITPDNDSSGFLGNDQQNNLSRVITANQKFSCNLYRQLAVQEKGNLAFSPHSISTALMMTLAGTGAETTTEEEIQRVLHQTLLRELLHETYGVFQTNLQRRVSSDGTQLLTANRLWAQQGSSFKPSFLENLRRNYGAEPEQLDFAQQHQQARQVINAWVARRTGDGIQQLLGPDSLSADTNLVLTNAVYFEGKWTRAFSPESTTVRPFRLSNTQSVPVPLMRQLSRFSYAGDDKLQVIEIPYGQKDNLAMMIFLPRQVHGYHELEATLDPVRIKRWLDRLQETDVDLQLPRFQLRSSLQLADVLKWLGMEQSFLQGRADFSGIDGKANLVLDEIHHQMLIRVDEQGTTAAAATDVVIQRVSTRRNQNVVFRVDHPFVFLIRDRRTGTILFMGRVTDPSPAG